MVLSFSYFVLILILSSHIIYFQSPSATVLLLLPYLLLIFLRINTHSLSSFLPNKIYLKTQHLCFTFSSSALTLFPLERICICLSLKLDSVLEKCMLKLAFSSHICTTSLKSFTSLRSTAKPRSTMLQWYLLLVSSWLCSFPCLCSVFLHFVCFFSSFFSYAINFETFFYLILLPYSELSLFIFSSKWGARKWVTFY